MTIVHDQCACDSHLDERAEGGIGWVVCDEEAHRFVAELDGGRPVHPGHTLKLTSWRNTPPDWASLHRTKQDTSVRVQTAEYSSRLAQLRSILQSAATQTQPKKKTSEHQPPQ